ncbi:MAG TPA: cobaltochelatase subunit CobN [Hyphomonadaceae bacterium]|nr:cobaltochelatase subunit CobN [Hyphomonadaceae bacterium]
MRQLLRSLFTLLCLALLPLAAVAQEKVRVTYLFSDGNIPGTLSAYDELLEEHPELRGRIELELLAESTFGDVVPDKLKGSNVLVFDTMNEQMLGRFNAENKTDLIADIKKRGTVLGVGEGLLPKDGYVKQGVAFDNQARAYWEHSGPNNQLALLKLALTKAGIKGLDLPRPESSIDFGYYYPDGKSGRVFATWKEFDAWRAANGKKHAGAKQVAVSFFKATYYSGDTAMLNAMIAEVEKQGADAIPMFGYPGAPAADILLKDEQGKPRADVILGGNFQFADTDAPKIMEKIGIPVINLISLYGRTEKEWRESAQGLSIFEGTFTLAVPELAGTVAPTVVGTKEKIRDPKSGLTSVVTSPIEERVTTAVSRALKYAELRKKPNAEKRIALIYYNYPPGKANIGASYLNVAESIANTLQRMKAEGYDVGAGPLDADSVLADITNKARNVMGAAPGELDEMIRAGGAVRVSAAEYRKWLDTYAPALKAKILKDWGEPEKTKLMLQGGDFIIPALRYGKTVLMPQPSRAWGEDLEKMYHAKDLAPHHQYVAAYAWLRNGYKADAVVHIGTHGTLEWLDGKDAGLSNEDAPDALIADLPDAYIYNVDVVGEGLVARRRGMATLIDHMVPPFKEGGLTEDLAKLSESMNDHSQNETKNPELAEAYGKQIQEQATALGIAKDLSLPLDKEWSDADLHRIENYLIDLKRQTIPYGLHAFGRTPAKDAIDSTVKAVAAVDRSLLPDKRAIAVKDMAERIETSGPRELNGLMAAIGGRFVPAGMGGEPIRNPDAYATGNNFYGIDPDKVPKPAAWEMGTKLAEQMLQDHLKKNGKYPEKVSFVIWGDETMRHEGVMESQIFYLLGTKPVWNARGKVVDVEVIPRSQLGRPRVDIVIASAAEGMFANVTNLMDQAVQKVKAMDEADNLVRKHYLATRAALILKGYKAEDADRMAGVRIFDEPPGQFNLNTSTIVASSGSWESDAGFANDYIRKLGHGYGNGYHGEAMPDVFRLNLADVETVVHSSSTALYGALDNDDMFMYMGGLTAAIRNVSGKDAETLVTNTRDPGKPEMTSLDKFVGQEFRSRYVNPEWIKGMQKEGYAGAGAMREFVEYLWGWDATVTSVVDDSMWKETFDTYVEDKNNLGMKQFFDEKSPFAYQDITARMIETVRKGYWKADEATKTKLLEEYIESIDEHGVSCTEVSCGNGRLLEYVMQGAAKAGVPAPKLAAARAALEKAMNKKIEVAAAELKDFAQKNEVREIAERDQGRKDAAAAAKAAPAPAAVKKDAPAEEQPQAKSQSLATADAPPAPPVQQAQPKQLEGRVMTEENRTPQKQAKAQGQPSPLTPFDVAWPAVVLLGLMAGWRWRGAFVRHA